MPPDRPRRDGPAPDHWRRAALAVWVVALILLGAKALLLPHRNTVYPIFAGAGRHWLEGADLYETPAGHDPYRYSPLVAAFFVPLSQLPDGAAGLLWRLIAAAAFLGGIAGWSRAVLPPTLTRVQRALLFLLPAPLALGNVHNGQANILIIGLLLLAVAAVARARFPLAGACLAVACLFKLYPIAVGLLLVALYPRRLAPRLALALAAGLALPFLLQRPDYVATQYVSWVKHLASNDRQVLPRAYWYRDARLLCSLWVGPMSYGAYQMLQGIGAGVVAGACLWARRSGLTQGRLLTLLLGLGCCWMTALGPATESSTYVLLGPTAAWLLLSGGAEHHPFGLRLLWVTGYGLLVASQAASTLPGGWGRAAQSLGPQPLAALLFLGGLLYLAVSWRRLPLGANAKPQAATGVVVGARR
ncbi:MAG TPA: glycosyltransferase 87 family protein [Gemmataceae bacterium]|nr:glycosyltransferase 87 family protein [Gemmataceae bacterium]